MNAPFTPILERLLAPVGRCFTEETARNLTAVRADPEAQARIAELADMCNEGTLSPEERVEYEAYIWTGSLLAILQAQARALLKKNGAAAP
jgi:hypothetical protein